MIYLAYIALGYLAVNTLILLANTRDFKPLPSSPGFPDEDLKVSICIPARNEEAVIERSVRSALVQSHSNLEVIALDDESTDGTPEILNRLQNNHPEKLYVIQGNQKPDNWIGKSWACHQLSKKAAGDVFIFLDADAWLEPDATNRILHSMEQHNVNFITVWPMQTLGTFWEKVVIPLIYYGLLTLLPARYVHRNPKWLPRLMAEKFSSSFAAACGQCLAFTKEAYTAIGGHASVKNKIVEDVALAKEIKKHGFHMRMHHGHDAVHCRMYRSESEMQAGFRKNFLALYNNSIVLFTLMAIINCIVYLLPFILLPAALVTRNVLLSTLFTAAILIIILQRLLLAWWYNWRYAYAVTHPLGVIWFLRLGGRVLKDFVTGIPPRWKGRSINETKSE